MGKLPTSSRRQGPDECTPSENALPVGKRRWSENEQEPNDQCTEDRTKICGSYKSCFAYIDIAKLSSSKYRSRPVEENHVIVAKFVILFRRGEY